MAAKRVPFVASNAARSLSSLRAPRSAGPRASRASPRRPPAPARATYAADPENSLLSPVNIAHDPNAVLQPGHPASSILDNSAVVVQRQLELGNFLLGFEQANKYVIMDPQGNHIGFMAEEESGIAKAFGRQLFRTHRPFTAHVFDKHENRVLMFHRPFAWINSRIRAYDCVAGEVASSGSLPIIGEAQQQWHLWRRKYNLFLHHNPPTSSFEPGRGSAPGSQYTQFAYVDEPLLSWDFSLLSANNALLGSVNRNFAGFGREIFTETGVYALRMDAAALAEEPSHLISKTGQMPLVEGNQRGMTLDERAVMLATAVSVDFDYFSSRYGGGFLPIPFFGEEARDSSGDVPAGTNLPSSPSSIPDISSSHGGTGGLGTGAVTGAMMGSRSWGSSEDADRDPNSNAQTPPTANQPPEQAPNEWWQGPGDGSNVEDPTQGSAPGSEDGGSWYDDFFDE